MNEPDQKAVAAATAPATAPATEPAKSEPTPAAASGEEAAPAKPAKKRRLTKAEIEALKAENEALKARKPITAASIVNQVVGGVEALGEMNEDPNAPKTPPPTGSNAREVVRAKGFRIAGGLLKGFAGFAVGIGAAMGISSCESAKKHIDASQSAATASVAPSAGAPLSSSPAPQNTSTQAPLTPDLRVENDQVSCIITQNEEGLTTVLGCAFASEQKLLISPNQKSLPIQIATFPRSVAIRLDETGHSRFADSLTPKRK